MTFDLRTVEETGIWRNDVFFFIFSEKTSKRTKFRKITKKCLHFQGRWFILVENKGVLPYE